MTMTCDAAASLLDAFVDCELPPATQLDVACHAGQCTACQGVVQDLLRLRENLVAANDAAVDAMDLSRVWPAVEARISREEGRQAWRARRADVPRRGRATRVVRWGVAVAIAASAMLMLRTPSRQDGVAPTGAPVRVAAAKRLPNSVYIDRLAGKDIALRREPKSGTTIIWVNHGLEASEW
jgi:anti-sigma factor RsiW